MSVERDESRKKVSVTQADVAALAGVSPMTVSRTLRTPERLKRSTLNRVNAAIKELNYYPNQAARSLATQKANTIVVIVPPVSAVFGYYLMEVLRGLEMATNMASVDLVLKTDRPDAGSTYEALFRSKMADAFIFVMPEPTNPNLIRLRESGDIPIISVGANIRPGASIVAVDNFEGISLAVRHLVGLGHRRIAHIAGFPDRNSDSWERIQAFRETMAQCGLGIPDGYVQYGEFGVDASTNAMAKLLALPDRPTAVCAANDLMAVGALKEAQRQGVRVPDDLSIVGFDDSYLAALVTPALTTIAQPMEEMGQASGEIALDMVRRTAEGEVLRDRVIRVLRPRLVERQSCGPYPAG